MPIKLVSMKIDPKSAEEMKESATSPMGDSPKYPWGLSVTLNEDALEALGLDDDLPKVDSTMMLYAKVTVTGVRSNESQNGSNQSVELQITDLCLEDAGSGKDPKTALYGDKGDE
jgi:hypothetical protein